MSLTTPPRKQLDSCTHGQITRLFNTNVEARCQRCGQIPSLGWVFRCVENSRGYLPAGDFGNEEPYQKQDLKDNRCATLLKPTLIKDIRSGHYSEEQVTLMEDQKRQVGQTITNQRKSERTLAARNRTERHHSTRFRFLSRRAPSSSVKEPRAQCTFRICLQCCPLLKERGFLKLDEVLSADIKEIWPPKHDWTNRRWAAVRLVRELGLKQVPVHCQEGSTITSSSGMLISTEEDNMEEEDLTLLKDAARDPAGSLSGKAESSQI